MPDRILVALGGHALVKPGQAGTIPEQAANLREALTEVVDLLRDGHRLILTHGNGPQVGHILIRAEAARGKAYDLPLSVCVAQSQGELGYLILGTLGDLLSRAGLPHRAVSLITRAEVDAGDPNLTVPVKPIGPSCDAGRAAELRRQGCPVAEDPSRGFRRIVPSPRPIRVLEAEIVADLLMENVVVIAGGGGGIPVVSGEDGLRAVDAVIDKDYVSAELAVFCGVSRMINLTSVERVKLNFRTDSERDLETVTAREARRYLAEGHFAPGTMKPKIESALDFLARGGREVLITCPGRLRDAWAGRTGTRIVP